MSAHFICIFYVLIYQCAVLHERGAVFPVSALFRSNAANPLCGVVGFPMHANFCLFQAVAAKSVASLVPLSETTFVTPRPTRARACCWDRACACCMC